MLPVAWLVVAVAVAVALTTWVTFTLTRLDRLHARVDAAQAALDAQLVRRAAALQHVAESPDSGAPTDRRSDLDAIASRALGSGDAAAGREAIENAVGRAVAELATHCLHPASAEELREAAARVRIARRFYNDAVRDTRALRARRLPRVFHMAGHRAMPEFFDIDDTVPPPAPGSASDGREQQAAAGTLPSGIAIEEE
ncbi:MAG TPA: NUDIX hydrolase [Jatrophihabitans sp.]|nr:NUDIX hydrolase [Jatrophihabitans sp.]